MGTSIKKIIFSSMFCGLILSGCGQARFPLFNYNNGPIPFVNSFKDRVFLEILKISYNNDVIFKLISAKDALLPGDFLNADDISIAKKVAEDFVKKMPPPQFCEDCQGGKNYFMAQALHYSRSKNLHRIAWNQYKKYKKNEYSE